ncbi:ATP-binding cassette domain-containing protein [Candidatus Saccharibacteria bacterium]|nr:ATP-binding cassette domain-containing protein [Candidatus Saccharibacteria bacterium]
MLKLNKISFTTGGSRKILDSISLKVRSGEFSVITGPNGSGKSTLAQIIIGIKNPTSGQIIYNKTDITNLSITERAKMGIAFSFQQPVKFKGVKVYDLLNVASGAMMEKAEAGKYLEKVGLNPEQYLLREVNDKLSGGELKRIEIATVLARDAKVLIFDEPEAGIDLWSFENLTKVFKKLKAEKKTIIVISHQERILKIADKIVILENGKIEAEGAPEKILSQITGANYGIN